MLLQLPKGGPARAELSTSCSIDSSSLCLGSAAKGTRANETHRGSDTAEASPSTMPTDRPHLTSRHPGKDALDEELSRGESPSEQLSTGTMGLAPPLQGGQLCSVLHGMHLRSEAEQSSTEQSNVCLQVGQPTPVCKLCQLGGSMDEAFDCPVVREGDIGLATVAT